MKIIAESGSTKTDWVIVDGQKVIHQQSTSGFNPTYFPASILRDGINELLPSVAAEDVESIHFYGSGCSSDSSKNIVHQVFSSAFANADIEIEHDLFGAARALFGAGKGIASILGTGSSSCLFEDHKIVYAVPSLGYLLADEGSGAHLGKLLLNAFFKNDLPKRLHNKFAEQFDLETGNFVPQLYAHKKPNTYIASFVPFILENKTDSFVKKIIINAFMDFFQENIFKYKNYKNYDLGFAGSVAFLFQDYLMEIANEFDLTIHKIIKNPIDELVKFHIGKSS